MHLKRTSPEEMIRIVRDFWVAHPGVLSGDERSDERFFVVPRYNALIRADPGAIRNFFSYMSTGDSWHTRALKPLLQAATRCRWVEAALARAGVLRGVLGVASYPGVRWEAVDALVAEWQFVACFSLRKGLVAHCLSRPKYHRCLVGEVEARRAVAGTVRVPELKEAHLAWPSGYAESIILGREKVGVEGAHFARAQTMLLRMYLASKKEVRLVEYLDRLREKAAEHYADNTDVKGRVERLLERAERSIEGTAERPFPLARCHGDFNRSQVVVEEGEPYLIDWSESEVASISHDLYYSAVFHLGWRAFNAPVDVPEMETLKEGLRSALHGWPPALLMSIMLVEVAVKQYVDYNERRGTIKGWMRVVDSFLETRLEVERASPAEVYTA